MNSRSEDVAQITNLINEFQSLKDDLLECFEGQSKKPSLKAQYPEYMSRELSYLYGFRCELGYDIAIGDPRYGDFPLGARDFSRKVRVVSWGPPRVKGNNAKLRITYDYLRGAVSGATYKDYGNFIEFKKRERTMED